MEIKLQAQWVTNSKDSSIAKGESKDCMVYATASAFGLSYDQAHPIVREKFDRENKKGTNTMSIITKMKEMATTRESINGKFIREIVAHPTKTYHVYGQDIVRANRVSTFLKEHSQGTYLILTRNHALTIKDGAMIDNITKGSGSALVKRAFKIEKVVD